MSQMNGGTVAMMFMLTSDSPVTELAVQTIPGQEQWEELDGFQLSMSVSFPSTALSSRVQLALDLAVTEKLHG